MAASPYIQQVCFFHSSPFYSVLWPGGLCKSQAAGEVGWGGGGGGSGEPAPSAGCLSLRPTAPTCVTFKAQLDSGREVSPDLPCKPLSGHCAHHPPRALRETSPAHLFLLPIMLCFTECWGADPLWFPEASRERLMHSHCLVKAANTTGKCPRVQPAQWPVSRILLTF